MSKSTALEPTVTVATAYKVAQNMLPIMGYSQALQPACSQAGNQSVSPPVSPSA